MLRYTGPAISDYSPVAPSDDFMAAVHSQYEQRLFRSPAVCPRPIEAPPERNPLVDKLTSLARLDREEIAALETLTRNPRHLDAERTLVHEGSFTDHVCLMVEGLACRFKMLADGRRQILGYLIPGDLCDVHFTVFNRPDHSVALLCDSRVIDIPIARLAELMARYPNIGRALALAGLVDSAILREWLLNVGQRDAIQKLSHFFCEMSVRMTAIGQVDQDGSFDLPVNQAALADTLGLTPVHINRVLQRLRSEGLIMLRQRRLTILDRIGLTALAGFQEYYLHMRRDRG